MKHTTSNIAIFTAGWSRGERVLLKAFGALAFALLTILGAHIRIPLPFTPVPMTLQTLVAPLAGGFLGAAWGTVSMLIYIAMGLAGLNVFAVAEGGIEFLLAPTAGYLFGFVIAAAILGYVRDRSNQTLHLLLGLIISHAVIFGCGVAGLMLNANMSLHEALTKGVYPFLIGDLLKITVSFPLLFSFNKLRMKHSS